MTDIEDTVLMAVKNQLGGTPRLTHRFKEDLHADSLDIVEITMAIEDDLGVEVNDDILFTLRTVQDMVEYLTTI